MTARSYRQPRPLTLQAPDCLTPNFLNVGETLPSCFKPLFYWVFCELAAEPNSNEYGRWPKKLWFAFLSICLCIGVKHCMQGPSVPQAWASWGGGLYPNGICHLSPQNLALKIPFHSVLPLTFLSDIHQPVFLAYNSFPLFPISPPLCTQVVFMCSAGFQVTSFFELFWLQTS